MKQWSMYEIVIRLITLGIRLAAPFHAKARLWVDGRTTPPGFAANAEVKAPVTGVGQETETRPKTLWVHAASLGEFEQGRPVIEAFREQFPDWRIVLTFFSPSGYEIRKNYPHADLICYLPADTRRNARDFLERVRPDAAVFVKYEFWANYLLELKKRNIPTLLVSALFRESQPFFQWYGGFWRQMLSCFTHFFVQNEASAKLLQNLGFQNVTVAGDTRVDRVLKIAESARENAVVAAFSARPGGGEGSVAPISQEQKGAFPAPSPPAQPEAPLPPTGGGGGSLLSGGEESGITLTPQEKKGVFTAPTPPAQPEAPLPPTGGGGGGLLSGGEESGITLTPQEQKGAFPAPTPPAQPEAPLPPTGGAGGGLLSGGGFFPNILIAGSTWPPDEAHLAEAMQKPVFKHYKLVIASHDPSERSVRHILDVLPGDWRGKALRYSGSSAPAAAEAAVLIIDNVGLLNTLYRYGTVAYIGGGFGKGIHNTLEPAAFGLPILFGPNYEKFEEARQFVARGGAFPVRNARELAEILTRLQDPEFYRTSSQAVQAYLLESKGATEKIISFFKKQAG